jgi:PAS domain S-box-containing protein
VTPSIRSALGYSPERFLGRRFTDLNILAPGDLLRALEDSRRVLAGETIESSIYSFIHKDGTTRIGEVSGAPLIRDGQIVGVVSVARDITDRWKVEQALKASEEKYRSILENIEEGYFEVDLKGNILEVNDETVTILGYSREELIGLNYRAYMDEENAKKVFEAFNAVFKTDRNTKHANWVVRRKDGTERMVESVLSLVYSDNLKPCGFRGLSRDVTERVTAEEALRKAYDELERRVDERTRELTEINDKLMLEIEERQCAEEELRKSEKRYRLLADNVDDIIWTMDANLHQTYCSPSVERIRGFTVEEAEGQSLEEILAPSSLELALKSLAEGRQELRGADSNRSRSWSLELELICKGGGTIWTEMNIRPIWDDRGWMVELVGVARDITRRRNDEERLRESLREKEVLLREIHHRVKNNLQLMTSMLDLQCQTIGDKATADPLKEAQNRIWAMAVAHETLYRSGDLASLTAAHYLDRLLSDLWATVGTELRQVALTQDLEDIPLQVDAAINCGLILNELLTNCFKHAFPDRKGGAINVSFKAMGENLVQLVVQDNGVGLPPWIDPRCSKTFGLNLVAMLVEEIRGKMNVSADRGTTFRIEFSPTGTKR